MPHCVEDAGRPFLPVPETGCCADPTQRTQGGLAQRWSSLLALRLARWRWGGLGRRHTSSLACACACRAALAWCPLEEQRWDRSSSLLEPPQQGRRWFLAGAAGDGGAALGQA